MVPLSPTNDLASSVRAPKWAEWAAKWTEINLRLLGKSPDPVVHACTLAEGLAEIFGAVAGHLLLCHLPGGPETLRIHKHLRIGDWAPAEMAAVNSYMQDVNRYPDPFIIRYIELGLHRTQTSRSRQELLSDEEWYSSEHYKRLRTRANQDACFYATMPARDGQGRSLEGEMLWTFCLCRIIGAPQFRPDEREFASACFFGMSELLFRTWTDPVSEGEVALSALPMRLRRIACRLLAGDSAKEAATALGISPNTANDYVKELYAKLGVTSRSELVLKLLRTSNEG